MSIRAAWVGAHQEEEPMWAKARSLESAWCLPVLSTQGWSWQQDRVSDLALTLPRALPGPPMQFLSQTGPRVLLDQTVLENFLNFSITVDIQYYTSFRYTA